MFYMLTFYPSVQGKNMLQQEENITIIRIVKDFNFMDKKNYYEILDSSKIDK